MDIYYILKRFAPGADIWVVKLDESDSEYSYSTLEEAEAALIILKPQYANNDLKIGSNM